MTFLGEKFKKISKKTWVLLAILLVGIFLRTYHFHDWLLFGPDQARDANIINSAMQNRTGPILLGAQAGNTQFYLGPIYYHLQYLSALIFGNSPDKLAYPDLLFSILTIPALFLLLRKYFSANISIFLSALFSIAYFSIYTARFAVNSNSLPFFMVVFLYGLLEVMDEKSGNKLIWAAIVGISLGVGIQLHALALVAMPLIAVAAAIYLLLRKNFHWASFCVVMFFFLLMNSGQLLYEARTGGANFKHFISGASSASGDSGENLAQNAILATFCQVRSNVSQLSSFSDSKYCAHQTNFIKTAADYKKPSAIFFIIEILLGVAFTLGGYWLWFRATFDKKLDLNRRRFLALLMFSNIVFIGLLAKVVFQAEVHYLNFIFFVPFVLLGLWIKMITESDWRPWTKKAAFILLAGTLLICNLYALGRSAIKYSSGYASDSEVVILGEIIPVVNYMIENSNGARTVYLDGDRVSFHRFSGTLEYLAARSGIEISTWHENNGNNFGSDTTLFYIKLASDDAGKSPNPDIIGGKRVTSYKKFGNVIIYILDHN